MNFKSRRNARYHAVQALYQKIIINYDNDILKKQFYLDNVNRHVVEWNFFYQLLDGVSVNIKRIDSLIMEFSIYDIKYINYIDISVIRLGLYEMIFCQDIPANVIISEYIIQSRLLGTIEGSKFVNSILHQVSKKYRII